MAAKIPGAPPKPPKCSVEGCTEPQLGFVPVRGGGSTQVRTCDKHTEKVRINGKDVIVIRPDKSASAVESPEAVTEGDLKKSKAAPVAVEPKKEK